MSETTSGSGRRSRRAARRSRNFKLAISALVVLVLGATGFGVYWWSERNVSADHFVKSAEQYAAKRDYASALIQVRNAAQKSPKDARVRFLFAQILEGSRDLMGAEKEARKAIELGYAGEEVLALLARTLLKTGRAEELYKEFGKTNLSRPGVPVSLKIAIGEANLNLERFDDAKLAFDSALRDDAQNPLALVGRAKYLLSQSDLEGAKKILTELTQRSPPAPEALSLQADLIRYTGDRANAIVLYQRLVELDPDDGSARFRLGRTYFEDKQIEKAEQTAAALMKRIPSDPRGGYLSGLVAMEKGDLERARIFATDVLSKIPSHGPSRLLAGIASVETGQYEQAKDHLRGLLTVPAYRVHAYKGLIKAYLRTDDASRARTLAEEALAVAPQDPILQTLAAEAAIRAGDLASAAQLFEKGSTQQAGSKARQGQVLIAAGQTQKGIEVLESAMQAPASKLQSALTLAVVHLQKREFDKTLPLLDEADKIEPKSPTAPALRGTVYLEQNRLKEARIQLEEALKRDPQNVVALDALARVDLKEGKADVATRRFEAALKQAPANESMALSYVYFLRLQKSAPENVTAVLDGFIRANPNALRTRLALMDLHLNYGNAAKAVAAGRDALAVHPNNLGVMRALGRAHLAANEAQQAITLFAKLAELQPKDALAWLQLSDAAHLTKNNAQALDAAKRARELAPADIGPYQRQARSLAASGDTSGAMRVAEDALRALPKSPASYVLKADLLANDKQWDACVRLLKEGIAAAPSTALATKLHDALLSSGKGNEAEAAMRAWLAAHPNDAQARGYFGERLALAGEFAKARKEFEALVAREPRNALALNNLAWVAFKLNDSGASSIAGKALALRPDDPVILDTLGAIKIAQGATGEGVDLLKRAVMFSPESNRLRLNLAKAQIQSGDRAGARKELEVVLGRGPAAGEKREAQELLSSL